MMLKNWNCFRSKAFGYLKRRSNTDQFLMWVHSRRKCILSSQENPIGRYTNTTERNDYSEEACDVRRNLVASFTGQALDNIKGWWGPRMSTQQLKGHIENPIGLAKVPIGIAGPLLFNGENANGDFLAPLATTEGTLVAAVGKGVKLMNLAGGVETYVIGKTMMRSPAFVTETPRQAAILADWISSKRVFFQNEIVSKKSRHTILTGITPVIMHNTLHMVFEYQTGDAAGQNMSTFATADIVTWIMENIERELPTVSIRQFSLTFALDGDKKASLFNMMGNRGSNVVANCQVPGNILREVMGIGVEETVRAFSEFQAASTRVGAVGFSINAANVLAAMFIATGQDVASIHESATCITKATKTPGEDAIDYSIHLPSLLIGTVGGGTGLPSQLDCLSIMDCKGDGKVGRLAEIIAGYTLALDIACSSALIANSFHSGHAKLGPQRA